MRRLLGCIKLLLLWELLFFPLQAAAFFKASPEDVHCFSFDNACNICIQEPDCKWCSSPESTNATGHHCFYKKTDLSQFCKEIENPANSPVVPLKDEPFTAQDNNNNNYRNIIQLKPQHVRVSLRKGVPVNFNVSYRQIKDYPLDLYYLMDLSRSMYEDKVTLARLGKNLAHTMRKLTSQFKIGFGSFVDKVMLPFVNTHPDALKRPCNDIDCATPFSFKNNLKLIDDDNEFVSEVEAAQISSNLDSPEGGFDALMQAMVCDEQIGWRKNVRKIIIFSTDAEFHSAGDGKLAGVVTPNDGQCHLNEKGYYDKFDEYDYPSIGQIDATARAKGINIIFAVKNHLPLYGMLSANIKDSAYGGLDAGSNNVIDLVTKVYNSITGKVEIGVKSNARESPLSVRFFTDCGVSGQMEETNVCSNIKAGTSFDFNMELMLSDCPEDGTTSTTIEIGTLQDSLTVDVDLLCDCECEKQTHAGYEPASRSCSYRGTKQCDVCKCDHGFYGERCQCSRGGTVSTDAGSTDQSKCRPEGSDPSQSVCSGRGRCECETCICWKKERHDGKYCQCDKGLCRHVVNSNVECSGNGKCDCNNCTCDPGFEGKFCECRSRQSCVPKDGGELCSGKGDCNCGKCECKVPHTGKHCEECPSCGQGKCLEFRPCVQCQVWGSGERRGKACDNCTLGQIPTLESLDALTREYAILCTFEDEMTGCEFNFTYKYSEEGYEIHAQRKQKCPEKIDILAVTFGVIGGIVAIGVLTLIIWKILTTIHDRREFSRFENDIKNAAWNTADNPLYEPATTTVSNPAFSKK